MAYNDISEWFCNPLRLCLASVYDQFHKIILPNCSYIAATHTDILDTKSNSVLLKMSHYFELKWKMQCGSADYRRKVNWTIHNSDQRKMREVRMKRKPTADYCTETAALKLTAAGDITIVHSIQRSALWVSSEERKPKH